MNDNELDEILKAWSTPPVDPSLRERVSRGFAGTPNPHQERAAGWRWLGFHWKGVSATLAITLAVLLLMVPLAHPQTAIPAQWTVDSEFLHYGDDGSWSVEMAATSYLDNGYETIWSRWSPENPITTALWQAADGIGALHNRIVSRLMFNHAKLEEIHRRREANRARTVGVITGCGFHCLSLEYFYFLRATPGPSVAAAETACIEGAVVDRGTILNYPVAAVRSRWTEHGRMTLWMAPDLGCFALRSTYEAEQPDGGFRLVSEKRAVKIKRAPAKAGALETN